jgi:hypothetical protein
MMKTWIGPPWTGSVEFATPTQVDISSAIALLPRGIMPRWLGRKQNKCDSYLGTACCSSGDPPRCRTDAIIACFPLVGNALCVNSCCSLGTAYRASLVGLLLKLE